MSGRVNFGDEDFELKAQNIIMLEFYESKGIVSRKKELYYIAIQIWAYLNCTVLHMIVTC